MWPSPPPVNDDAQADKHAESGNADDSGKADVEGSEDVEQGSSTWVDWPVHAKLAMVLDHLRQTYHYCIFCGCQVRMIMHQR